MHKNSVCATKYTMVKKGHALWTLAELTNIE